MAENSQHLVICYLCSVLFFPAARRISKELKNTVLSATNLVITGMPGSGQITVFRRLVDKLRHLNPVGFYSAEIRKGGVLKGFNLRSLDGRTGVLSHLKKDRTRSFLRWPVKVRTKLLARSVRFCQYWSTGVLVYWLECGILSRILHYSITPIRQHSRQFI